MDEKDDDGGRPVEATTAKEILSSAQFKINYARNIGADVKAAEGLLRDAMAALSGNDHERALELARQCRDEAERAKERYKELVDLIYETQKLISEAHAAGKGTLDAEERLSSAIKMKSTDTLGAIIEAMEGRSSAEWALGRRSSLAESAIGPADLVVPWSSDIERERANQFILASKATMNAIAAAKAKGVNASATPQLVMLATELFLGCLAKRIPNIDTAFELVQRSRTMLDQEIDLSNPVVKPDLGVGGFFSKSLRLNDWCGATLVLQNTGKTAALEVGARLSGDIEMEHLQPVEKLAPGEKKALKVRLRSRRPGDVPFEITVSFKRAYDNKPLEVKHEVKLAVK